MSDTSNVTSNPTSTIEVVTTNSRKRRWTWEQKLAILKEAEEPGKNISSVARAHGIAPSQVFLWRRLMENGQEKSLDSNDQVISLSEYKKLQDRVNQLEKVLGKKTLQNELLKDAVRIAKEKKLISRVPSILKEDSQ